ncbi:hypothetical protein CHARACLAT_021415 [Characodon lateralis]|uniref:Uncharacterized protein n=1 Tax=Characodon lateralis TaxID=208331 RepID=A0ABU7DIK4_9TELE|nr:hypothetical protein [Characodon lateralis]
MTGGGVCVCKTDCFEIKHIHFSKSKFLVYSGSARSYDLAALSSHTSSTPNEMAPFKRPFKRPRDFTVFKHDSTRASYAALCLLPPVLPSCQRVRSQWMHNSSSPRSGVSVMPPLNTELRAWVITPLVRLVYSPFNPSPHGLPPIRIRVG